MSALPEDPASPEDGGYRIWIDNVGWRTYDLPMPAGGRYRFEIDRDDYWWLIKDGQRCNRRKWRPADPWEALVAADLIHALNNAGPTPIRGEFLKAAKKSRMPVRDVQWELRKASFSLWLHKLIRSAYGGKS